MTSPTPVHAYIGDIVKSYRDDHGDLVVYGKAAGPDRDLDGERCDPVWLRKAVPSWFEWGNIREQHSNIAAGVGLEITEDGDDWHIKALITDQSTAHKVETGTLKGWSLGAINGRIHKDASGQKWLTGGDIVEFSLVDRPCNPTTTLAVAKTVGGAAGADWESVPIDDTSTPAVHKAAGTPGPADPPAGDGVGDGGQPGEPGAVFDRGAALEMAATVLRGDRAGALKLAGPHIVKAVAADGSKDEAPDIAGGRAVITMLARLICAEAEELAAGHLEEACDITLLNQAVECVKWWLYGEEASAASPSSSGYTALAVQPAAVKSVEPAVEPPAPAAVEPPAEPIPAPAVEPAVEPVIDKVAGGGSTLSVEEVTRIAKAAAAEATKVAQAEITSLRDELAQVKSRPVPGGPFVVAPATATVDVRKAALADYRARAATSADAGMREAYRALADKTEAEMSGR